VHHQKQPWHSGRQIDQESSTACGKQDQASAASFHLVASERRRERQKDENVQEMEPRNGQLVSLVGVIELTISHKQLLSALLCSGSLLRPSYVFGWPDTLLPTPLETISSSSEATSLKTSSSFPSSSSGSLKSDLKPGNIDSSSRIKNKTPQINGGWCNVTACNIRLTKAFTRLAFKSDLNALKSKLRYNACLDDVTRRGSSRDS
jgi:hypothetical protein